MKQYRIFSVLFISLFLFLNIGCAQKSGTAKDNARFVKDSEGVITDSSTGLQWFSGPDRIMSWNEAKAWVSSLDVDKGNWKMPTMVELKGIATGKYGKYQIDPIFELDSCCVWSGETKESSFVWVFHFPYGPTTWNINADATLNARTLAVRSRK
ncbi:MAG: DUF1566 domain-containing protein [Nitrospirota bacterium]|nr:DUF1566 domain-containing protein [Nitrospirota bacterium]